MQGGKEETSIGVSSDRNENPLGITPCSCVDTVGRLTAAVLFIWYDQPCCPDINPSPLHSRWLCLHHTVQAAQDD